jgi:hypothetical protein
VRDDERKELIVAFRGSEQLVDMMTGTSYRIFSSERIILINATVRFECHAGAD